jgi:hypothetical protein
MLPGFIDTAAVHGQSVYGGTAANELSAMPSVHVAWAVLVAWYTMRVGRGRWRYLGPAHAIVTVLVIVVTANHWWLDGVVAIAVLVASAWAYVGVTRGWAAAIAAYRHRIAPTGIAPPRQQAAPAAATTVSPDNRPCAESLSTAPEWRSDEITRVASDDR